MYDDLRAESCEFIKSLDTPGVAIGGLSVGESKEDMYRILDVLAPILPPNKPCVLPTRIGRHGEAFSSYGNLKI